MRHLAILLAAAAALADDGGIAPATRWSHARGAASNSGQSHAEPPETFGGIKWTYKAKAALFPPVVWDGAIFLVDGDAKAADLVAIDAETGKPWARIGVRAPGQPALASRNAFLLEEGKTLVQISLDGRTLSRQWTFDVGAGASPPRIVDDEIYVTTPTALLSLRPGLSRPAWKVEGAFTGEPAARDGHVYALRRDGAKLALSAYARADGKEATSVTIADPAEAGPGGRIVVGNRIVGALLPPEKAQTWAVLARNAGTAELTLSRTEKLLTEPFVGDRLLLAMSPDRAWTMYYTDDKNPRIPRVAAADRPELFEAPAAAIWLGESCQVYGDWCGDLIGNAVFWHARERPQGAALRKGLRFHPVPARDALLLLVPADGKSMLALVPEEIG